MNFQDVQTQYHHTVLSYNQDVLPALEATACKMHVLDTQDSTTRLVALVSKGRRARTGNSVLMDARYYQERPPPVHDKRLLSLLHIVGI